VKTQRGGPDSRLVSADLSDMHRPNECRPDSDAKVPPIHQEFRSGEEIFIALHVAMKSSRNRHNFGHFMHSCSQGGTQMMSEFRQWKMHKIYATICTDAPRLQCGSK